MLQQIGCYRIVCNACLRAAGPPEEDVGRAQRDARECGWGFFREGAHMCPQCQQELASDVYQDAFGELGRKEVAT